MTRRDFHFSFDREFDGAVRDCPSEHDPALWTFGLEAPLAEPRPVATRETLRRFRSIAATGAAAETEGRPCPNVYDFSGLRVGADPLPITLGHVSSHLIGHADRVAICQDGVLVEGVVWMRTPHARAVLDQRSIDVEWKASVVVDWLEVEHVPAGEAASVNGSTIQGPVEIVRRGRLVELGFAIDVADPATIVLFDKERPGDVDAIREKLRARGALERVSLLEAWELLSPDARMRIARKVFDARSTATTAGEPVKHFAPGVDHHADRQVVALQASDEMERALVFGYWAQTTASTQQEIADIVRDDFTPASRAADAPNNGTEL